MRSITVTLDPGRVWGEVAGHKARGLLVSVDARPVWISTRRVWSTSYAKAIDAIALAQRLNYVVTVVGAPAPVRTVAQAPHVGHVAGVTDETPDEGGLW
jgi:hypothetical protein